MKPRRKQVRSRVADALFTITQQRLLTLLFCHPDRAYHTNELIDLAGAGSGSVQRVLLRLEASGLLQVEMLGKRRLFRANRSAPVFRELHDLMLKTTGLVDPLRSALEPMGARLELALVYGSVAKGLEHAESDVDVLLVGRDLTLEEVFAALAPAEHKIGRRISPTLYSPDELAQRLRDQNPFLTSILADDHILVIGDAPLAAR